MNIKNILGILITSSFLSANVFAGVEDVKPKRMVRGDTYVRTTILKDKKIKIEECSYQMEDSTCENIKEGIYKIDDLKKQRAWELLHIPGAVLADIGVVIGFASGYATILGPVLAGGALMGRVARPLDKSNYFISSLNPVDQYEDYSTLSDDFIYDRDVIKNEHQDIHEFISRLEALLDKIKK